MITTLSDRSPILEYNYSDADRLVKCKCCGTMVPVSETVTKDHMTFCRDSAKCVWHKQGMGIKVEILPPDAQFKKPLFGD